MAFNIGVDHEVRDRNNNRTNQRVDTMGNLTTFRNGRFEKDGYVSNGNRYDNHGNWQGKVTSDKRVNK